MKRWRGTLLLMGISLILVWSTYAGNWSIFAFFAGFLIALCFVIVKVGSDDLSALIQRKIEERDRK